MRRQRKTVLGLCAGGLGAVAVVAAVVAQTSGGAYDLSWRSMNGGGKSTGGNYSEQGVIGQALAKSSTGGSYTISSGFLGGGAEKYKRYLPVLSKDGPN